MSAASVEIFNYGERAVRTVHVDGDPWFVAADVCEVLGYDRVSNALRLVDTDDLGTHIVSTNGTQRAMQTVNEAGLYDLILRSRRPDARQFKRWVTHEVLPAIRRTGSYSATPAIPQTYAEALQAAADMARELEAAQARIAIEAPKAATYDRVIESEGMFSMTGIADMCSVSVNTFTGWLADLGVFRKGEYEPFPGRKLPRKQYQDHGLFTVKIETNDKGIYYPVAYATPAGLDFTMKLLRENGLID